ncbi:MULTISPECIES: T9SS type A sorting domain-containing protein [Aequorivita]|uniref:T9SS type A sorting domain-containing protein n=1 Tax=Aequorivita iocasae TaxID=2803865 RepID=A0ABX7DSZ7_9FLAO|nr:MULTISPECIES: T9SS type A sorting domain-containing protein [Aequorivita]QQX76673.1 T9SS type A sorting domain-containing protein [Aequorivita iocasae]UCA56146.1 T9SS type A sorting domain-containing protein [Aequorivita sp. F7]
MKKITLLLACFIGSVGLINAQSSFTGDGLTQEPAVTIESLLTRLQTIGNVSGNINEYFTPAEQRMLNVHFNGVENIAPVVITQSNTQNIEAGAEIACASPTSFRNNNVFRAFDLAGDYGIMNGLDVTAVEFAIGTISTPTGFPITANIYSATPGAFPGGTLTLQGTAVYNATNADAATMITLPLTANIPPGEAMVMELVLVDDGTDTNFMRFGCNNDGQTGPSYIQAPDCGAATPTDFAALGLTQGLVWNVLGDDEPGGGGGPAMAFGINNTAASLVSWDPADPSALTTLGASPAAGFENAGAIDPNDEGTAYVLDNGGAFYSVDLASGTYTSLGTIAGPGTETWAGAEFDPSTGDLYAVSTNVTTSSLSLIDIAGVSSTLVGPLTGMAGAISLIIDNNGDAYSHDIVDDNLYFIDLATGAATPVGPLGFNANFGQGGCYGNGSYYLSAYNADAGQSQWRELDVTDGSSTLIGLFNGGSDQVAWSSVIGDTQGVSENSLKGFSYYPNPANDVISLKAANSIDSVAIYNLLGQQVLSAKVGATTSDLNIAGLTTGTYIMKVTVNGQTGTYKVLKN